MSQASRQFGGQEDFTISPERLYAIVTSLETIAATIPDLQSSERVNDDTLRCVVKPGFSFLRGTLKMTMQVERSAPPHEAMLRTTAQGIGVGMSVESHLTISALGNDPQQASGARLVWQAEATELKGLVASLSPGLVRAAAEQVIREVWTRMRVQVEKQTAG